MRIRGYSEDSVGVGHYNRRMVAGYLWDGVRTRLLVSLSEALEAGVGSASSLGSKPPG